MAVKEVGQVWVELRWGRLGRLATSLGTAFGIVIGMVWTQVVLSAFATGGIPLTTTGGTWFEWGTFVITAVIVTLICVIAIVFIGRWGGKE